MFLKELYKRLRFLLRQRNRKQPPPPQPKILDAHDLAEKALNNLVNSKYVVEDLITSGLLSKEDISTLESFYVRSQFSVSNFRNEIINLYQQKEALNGKEDSRTGSST